MSSCHRHYGVDDSRWGAFPEATQPVSSSHLVRSGDSIRAALRAPTWQGQAPAEDSHTIADPLRPAQRRARYAKKLLISGGHHT